MSSAVLNLVAVLFLMQVANRLDMTNPSVVLYVRLAYVLAQLAIFGAIYYTYRQVRQRNDKTEFEYTQQNVGEEKKVVKTVVHQYDVEQLVSLAKQTLVGVVILVFVCYKWDYVQPMFLQTFMPFKTVFGAPVVKVNILGYKAEGDLARPWVPKLPFGGMTTPKEQKKEE